MRRKPDQKPSAIASMQSVCRSDFIYARLFETSHEKSRSYDNPFLQTKTLSSSISVVPEQALRLQPPVWVWKFVFEEVSALQIQYSAFKSLYLKNQKSASFSKDITFKKFDFSILHSKFQNPDAFHCIFLCTLTFLQFNSEIYQISYRSCRLPFFRHMELHVDCKLDI